MKNQKSETYSEEREREEWRKPGEDSEINVARAFDSHPGFFETHLAGAPNLKAVRALLALEKK